MKVNKHIGSVACHLYQVLYDAFGVKNLRVDCLIRLVPDPERLMCLAGFN